MKKISWWQEPDEHITAGKNKLIKKQNRIKQISFIIILISVFIIIFSVVFTFLRKDESESAESLIFYSPEESVLDIKFKNNSFSVPCMSSDKIYKSRTGNTIVAVDDNGKMSIFNDGKLCCEVSDTENAAVSSDGRYVIYVKNAKSAESVFDSELMTGELIYYDIKSNISQIVTDEKGAKAEVVNKYIAISPSGESFAYSCSYTEKNTDKESASAEFKTVIVKKFGKTKETLPNMNCAVINLSNDGNIIYWYEKNYNQGKDDDLVITNIKKKVNTPCGKISNSSTTLLYNNDCTQLMVTDSDLQKTSVYENAVSINAEYNCDIISLCGLDSEIASGAFICDNLIGQYYRDSNNSVVYLNSRKNSFEIIVSGNDYSDITVDRDKSKVFFMDKASLYYKSISGKNNKLIAENVSEYSYSDLNNNVYLLSEDGHIRVFNLNGKKQAEFEENFKDIKYILCDKFTYIISDKDMVYYIDENNKLKTALSIDEDIENAYINENILYCVCSSTVYSIQINSDGSVRTECIF